MDSSNNFHVDKGAEKKRIIRYKECMKNHAAAMGGNATDGCGEFMAAGDEGTIEALKCSACSCHRNFHRKLEIIEESDHYHSNCIISPHEELHYGPPILGNSSSPNKSGSISLSDQSDEKDYYEEYNINKEVEKNILPSDQKVNKKRFRTKFTAEQKEKMLCFAEKVGWKIQKLDESVVHKFCQEVGIKRRVLKVWMHNNKNTYAKRNLSTTSTS